MPLNPTNFEFQHNQETGVATVTLNEPERLNALTFESYQELTEAFKVLHRTTSVRAIVITGKGRAFCSGGDVEKIIGQLFDQGYPGLLEFTRMTGSLIASIRRCGKPVVGALNGVVAGAGAVVAAACDLRIASEKAKIAFLFTKVGLSGADMGAAWLLPRLIGSSKASELLMLGDFIDAQEAYRVGLYNRVVPHDSVLEEATKVAERLAKGPTFALGMTKELIDREAAVDLDTGLEMDSQAQAACMQHPNFLEGYKAFKEQRKPEFKGD
jgi:enoyl-CoA hydratase/carnithine racemase